MECGDTASSACRSRPFCASALRRPRRRRFLSSPTRPSRVMGRCFAPPAPLQLCCRSSPACVWRGMRRKVQRSPLCCSTILNLQAVRSCTIPSQITFPASRHRAHATWTRPPLRGGARCCAVGRPRLRAASKEEWVVECCRVARQRHSPGRQTDTARVSQVACGCVSQRLGLRVTASW